MGARQTKRSVDISTTPKKDKEGVAEEKLEKIEDQDLAKVQNGTAHTENQETAGGDENAMVNGGGGDEDKVEDAKEVKEKETTNEENKESTTPAATPEQEKVPEKSEEKSDKKKKEKSKKKWSFRSISFSKKDKSKPNMSREDSKTGDLAKEAAVPEVAEVVENQEKTPSETTPKTEEAVSPVSTDETKGAVVTNEEIKTITVQETVVNTSSSNDEKKEEVKEEDKSVSNLSQEIVEKVVESCSTVVTKVTESSSVTITSTQHVQEIVEMKTEESIVPPLPASPPPTEAPPPTPVAPQPQQPEHEEVNGGGESMAELPEENGLGPDAKLEDEDEIVPKVNGHHDDSPVKQVVDSIIETIKTPEQSEKLTISENIAEVINKEKTAVEE